MARNNKNKTEKPVTKQAAAQNAAFQAAIEAEGLSPEQKHLTNQPTKTDVQAAQTVLDSIETTVEAKELARQIHVAAGITTPEQFVAYMDTPEPVAESKKAEVVKVECPKCHRQFVNVEKHLSNCPPKKHQEKPEVISAPVSAPVEPEVIEEVIAHEPTAFEKANDFINRLAATEDQIETEIQRRSEQARNWFEQVYKPASELASVAELRLQNIAAYEAVRNSQSLLVSVDPIDPVALGQHRATFQGAIDAKITLQSHENYLFLKKLEAIKKSAPTPAGEQKPVAASVPVKPATANGKVTELTPEELKQQFLNDKLISSYKSLNVITRAKAFIAHGFKVGIELDTLRREVIEHLSEDLALYPSIRMSEQEIYNLAGKYLREAKKEEVGTK